MENKGTEYIDGDADEFTIFLFSEPPKEKNSIKLELNPKETIHIGLHIFQELLMILEIPNGIIIDVKFYEQNVMNYLL